MSLGLFGDLGGTNLRLFLLELEVGERSCAPAPIRSHRFLTKELQLKSDGDAETALIPALLEFVGDDVLTLCVLSVNGPVDKGEHYHIIIIDQY